MKRILFLCTGNSARSQMAEGWVNHLLRGSYKAESAGVAPSSLNPYAVEVMRDAGIDIGGHRVNRPEDFKDKDFDYLITLCDHARESCPLFLTEKPLERLHWGFPDPAEFRGSAEDTISFFKDVRDGIRDKIISCFEVK